nr:hypothetical protein [Deltaproteobacteria bacterium]
HAARAVLLGPIPTPDIPAALESAYNELTGLHVGVIGVGRVGVAGRLAEQPIAAIVAARRIDLLRAILRGPNPVGRVNAACALLAGFANLLDDTDREAIRIIKALPIPIMMQSGCTMMEKRAAELIP